VEAEGLRWEITLPLNTEKSIGTAERGRPTPSSMQGPRTILPAAPPEPLKGKRFLIVEDEPLIALDIVAGLEGVGVKVEGPIGSVRDALRAIEEGSFDGVLLDANLRGDPVDEVAAALIRHNIPFAFVTGYGRQALPESFARATVLTKPFTQEQLLRTVSQLVESDRTGLQLLHDRDRHG
jgi:CheY-like chemotaxis protein